MYFWKRVTSCFCCAFFSIIFFLALFYSSEGNSFTMNLILFGAGTGFAIAAYSLFDDVV